MPALRNALIGAGALLTLAVSAGAASAAPGYVTYSTWLRAGPGGQYPAIARMHAGQGVYSNLGLSCRHACVCGPRDSRSNKSVGN